MILWKKKNDKTFLHMTHCKITKKSFKTVEVFAS